MKIERVRLKGERSPFHPDLTPHDMLRLGVFGGHYFDSGDYADFPEEWQDDARSVNVDYDPLVNLFKIKAGFSMQEWIDRGWIRPADPKGWFQWYCRYYLGRRGVDDDWQIQRWRNFTRHVGMLKHVTKGLDPTKGYGHRQSLLHWAYDPFADMPMPKGCKTVMQKVEHYIKQCPGLSV